MPTNWKDSGWRLLWVAALMIVLDQLSKIWVINNFALYESVALMPSLNFTYVHNPGAAFSFLADKSGWQRWLFSLLAMGVSIALLFFLRQQDKEQSRLNLSYVLILGGAIGNLIDRIAYGYVIDFVDFYVGNWHWPAFNIADAAIVIGAGLMLLDAFLTPEAQEENK